jgi:hypothetical protein
MWYPASKFPSAYATRWNRVSPTAGGASETVKRSSNWGVGTRWRHLSFWEGWGWDNLACLTRLCSGSSVAGLWLILIICEQESSMVDTFRTLISSQRWTLDLLLSHEDLFCLGGTCLSRASARALEMGSILESCKMLGYLGLGLVLSLPEKLCVLILRRTSCLTLVLMGGTWIRYIILART